ncbi:hypothetical protein PCC7424_3017 [Gloeothece citriformis PCC 7424]|uniref:Uncharacterized protein n=1 Tax=Gloeothece citriformis (strain PCC 7424) TaxID=65393 RepID=B7KA63_GLOC7|nr:hypothetical protein [Gloeothece citriformis]ACK71419.1 hypothetical protein PCC7424_3017 [Gloeothece citriformis PCC 7424]
MNSQSREKIFPNPTLSHSQEWKHIKVRIFMVNQQELLGTLIIPSQGYKARLSDILNNPLKFLSLTDVAVYHENLLILKTPFLSVNKQNILYLIEDDSNEIKNNLSLPVELD